jgi:hypothetical protein
VPPVVCINLPGYLLQILCAGDPAVKHHPCAVLSVETATGTVLQGNRAAVEEGVRPGMRYAEALAVCPSLQGRAVSRTDRDRYNATILETLYTVSDVVEPCDIEDGVWWINGTGFSRLYGGTGEFCFRVQDVLAGQGVVSRVVAGWSRRGTFIASRVSGGPMIFPTEVGELSWIKTAPLSALGLDAGTRKKFYRLGVTVIGEFLDLPERDLLSRFNDRTMMLFRWVRSSDPIPLQPVRIPETPEITCRFPDTPRSVHEIAAVLRRAYRQILGDRGAGVRLEEVEIGFECEEGESWTETVRPAGSGPPDIKTLIKLTDLRLETLFSGRGVSLRIKAVRVRCVLGRCAVAQGELFRQAAVRDPGKGEKAIAVLRARFGDNVACIARVVPGFFPENRFEWVPVDRPRCPDPEKACTENGSHPRMIRRICEAGRELSRAFPEVVPDPCGALAGPFIVSGPWWRNDTRLTERETFTGTPPGNANSSSTGKSSRTATATGSGWGRAYYYVPGRSGRFLWVYFDQVQRCWVLHGWA